MPTNRENIEKWSKGYSVLKHYVDFCFKFYFRTTVAGTENIPRKGSLIFTPNHQNALMDALGFLTVNNWQPVFLARADIFEKPLINKILTFLKILPVYRFRDGYENLTKNDAIFNKTMDILRNRNGLVILPEGNHGGDKRLRRPLKKGFARIAFQSEDMSNGELDIKIVPVGIDYTHYLRVGSKMHIRFGPAINVKPLLSDYRNNPAKAYNLLIELLENGLKKEMIHIEDEKYYKSYCLILDSFTRTYLEKQKLHPTHENMLDAQSFMITKINELKENDFDTFLLLMANTLEFDMLLKKTKLDPTSFPSKKNDFIHAIYLSLILFGTLPIFLFSFINNVLPLTIPYLATKKIKDIQFHSTVRFVLGILGFPLLHLIQTLIFGVVSGSIVLTLAYAISLPLSVYAFFTWREYFFSTISPLREMYLEYKKSKELNRAKEVYNTLLKKMWNISQSISEEEYLPSYMAD